ncbi:MAG TPA: hypothetical protein VHV32_00345 [Candidatus Angelobacter sp.]|jgi:hypothetical protein|nr:hypothetical protein [Candidatus Angelobacter sp.]
MVRNSLARRHASHSRLFAFMALCAITAVIIWPNTSSPISATQQGEKVSSNIENDLEIQRLTKERDERREAAEFWDKWNIRATFFAGLAGTCLVVTAMGVSKSNGELVKASDELSVAKEAQTGTKIAGLGIDLATQQERAAKAEKSLKDVDTKTEGFRLAIAGANERASKAQESLALAEQHSAEANAKAESFRLDIAKANERASDATKVAEQEHLARVRIEEKLAGWSMSAGAQARLIEKIKRFENTPFDLGANPSEAGFMEVIDSILLAAKWKRQIPKPDNPLGIILLGNKARINLVSGFFVEYAASRDKEFRPAATVLIEALRAEGIPAQGQIAPNEPDDSAIHIVIGSK